MKIFRILMLVAGLSLVVGTAQAAVDPLCVGASQAPLLDYSTGTGRICLSQAMEGGVVLADTKVVACTITFLDADGTDIGSDSFTGAPGELFNFSVPRDGIGNAVSVCTVDGLSSGALAGTVTVVFPIDVAPEAPITLPSS